jgi:hypothetical protein
VTRGELHPEARQHVVEAPVLERQLLGVGGDPLDLHIRRGGAVAAGDEELRREVGGDHPGAPARGGNGSVAPAGRDVENLVAGHDAGARHHPLADVLDELSDQRIVARCHVRRWACFNVVVSMIVLMADTVREHRAEHNVRLFSRRPQGLAAELI